MRWPTTRSTSLAAGVAALALLAGCGGGDAADTASTAGTDLEPIPTVTAPPPVAGPPPLRVLTERGEAQMVAFGGCWTTPDGTEVCGDPEWPSCPTTALPDIPAAPGDELTFVLPSPAATELELYTGDGSEPIPLEPAAKVDWNVEVADGPIVLRAVIPGRGDPSWAACLLPMG